MIVSYATYATEGLRSCNLQLAEVAIILTHFVHVHGRVQRSGLKWQLYDYYNGFDISFHLQLRIAKTVETRYL